MVDRYGKFKEYINNLLYTMNGPQDVDEQQKKITVRGSWLESYTMV